MCISAVTLTYLYNTVGSVKVYSEITFAEDLWKPLLVSFGLLLSCLFQLYMAILNMTHLTPVVAL